MSRFFPLLYCHILIFIFIFISMNFALAAGNPPLKLPVQIKKLPHFHTLSDEQFKSLTEALEIAPDCEKTEKYILNLPKGWKRLKYNDCTKSAKDQNRGPQFKDKHGESYILITEHDIDTYTIKFLNGNISAQNWLIQFMLKNGCPPIGMDKISDTRAEAVYEDDIDEGGDHVRSVAEQRGSRIVVMEYKVQDKDWKKLKALQEKVVESFRIINSD